VNTEMVNRRLRLPWYAWPLAPFALVAGLVVMVPLGILALVLSPIYVLYPDHTFNLYDKCGTPHQRQRLTTWRAMYRRLSLPGRIARAHKLRMRRRKETAESVAARRDRKLRAVARLQQ